jgi:hypothetical protein
MSQQQSDFNQRWVQHQRSRHKTTLSYGCVYCTDRKVLASPDELFDHACEVHRDKLPSDDSEEGIRKFREQYEAESLQKRSAGHFQLCLGA